ncbi:MAG: helix-turn-helix transcriptional regulator [Clostridia bacterium]|nr:helix-turn-helix transcriptional regulator [Clostridia bacterium]
MDREWAVIGARIREARKSRRMSQNHLAEMCNVNASYVGQIERGERRPSLRTLAALATALGTDASSLLLAPKGPRDLALQRLVDAVSNCPPEVIDAVALHAQVVVSTFRSLSECAVANAASPGDTPETSGV